ncbi:a-factor receptor [Pleurotus pulmonarius]|nr:a-factor receptor [Pleurotus pulmonarius]
MALATTEILFTIPLASFVIYLNTVSSPIGPWISWEDTHFAFSRMEQIPGVLWRMNPKVVLALELTRWASPFCAFVFFGFFGFADEAQRHYKMAFWAVLKPFGVKPASAKRAPAHFVSIGEYDGGVFAGVPTSSATLPSFANDPDYELDFLFDAERASGYNARGWCIIS